MFYDLIWTHEVDCVLYLFQQPDDPGQHTNDQFTDNPGFLDRMVGSFGVLCDIYFVILTFGFLYLNEVSTLLAILWLGFLCFLCRLPMSGTQLLLLLLTWVSGSGELPLPLLRSLGLILRLCYYRNNPIIAYFTVPSRGNIMESWWRSESCCTITFKYSWGLWQVQWKIGSFNWKTTIRYGKGMSFCFKSRT